MQKEIEMTNTQLNELDGVWLDTNVLISLLYEKAILTNKTQLNVKKVLLLGHTIHISTLALEELILSKNTANISSNYVENRIQSLFEPAQVLFHDPPPFNMEQLEKVGIKVLPSHKIDHPKLSHFDQIMILQSVLSECPILSEDKVVINAIQNVGKQFKIPFPIDEIRLEKVKIEDILRTPGSMRSILFNSLKEIKNISDIEIQKEKLRQKVSDLLQSNEILSDLAKPKATETILWTLLDLTTSILPIPLPTTPIASYLQFRRYKKATKNDPIRTNR